MRTWTSYGKQWRCWRRRDPQVCRDPADRLRSQPRQLHGPLAELLWAGSGHPGLLSGQQRRLRPGVRETGAGSMRDPDYAQFLLRRIRASESAACPGGSVGQIDLRRSKASLANCWKRRRDRRTLSRRVSANAPPDASPIPLMRHARRSGGSTMRPARSIGAGAEPSQTLSPWPADSRYPTRRTVSMLGAPSPSLLRMRETSTASRRRVAAEGIPQRDRASSS